LPGPRRQRRRASFSEKETIARLAFGDTESYKQAMQHLGEGSNDFYRLLAQGTLKAAEHYGGKDFACVLGQEMGGYATGEVFFVSQALGLRHSHLDAGGYSYDQKQKEKMWPTPWSSWFRMRRPGCF
jgi:aldehyde:ferredoxin oxidoreductase